MRRWGTQLLIVTLALAMTACAARPAVPAVPTAPKYPDYPQPLVPTDLAIAPDLRERHEIAWRRFQSGDLRGASRDFAEILKRAPGFYPAETALGFVLLADRQLEPAAVLFRSATGHNDQYLPAWIGRAEAELALGNDAATIISLERIVTLDPRREDVKGRLELLQFKELQSLIETARRARQAGRYDEAIAAFQRALDLSPTSRTILQELALAEREAGALPVAEAHARRALGLDERDAESHALLATILERQDRFDEAADAYARASALEPRAEWRERTEALRKKGELARIPAEFREISAAEVVTRAQAAAYVGIRLDWLMARAPRRVAVVITDLRNHWAAPWILTITQAGVMEVFPNHTFQPSNPVRRGDLARIVMQLLQLIPQRQADIARWRNSRPRFADLPAGNLYYPAAAFAVAADAMTVEGDRFHYTRPASGAELAAAIARVEQLAGRR